VANVKPTFRVSFLPAFFTGLFVILAGAISYRILSYSQPAGKGAPDASDSVTASSPAGGRDEASSGTAPDALPEGPSRLKAADEKRQKLLAEELARSEAASPSGREMASQPAPGAPPAGPASQPPRVPRAAPKREPQSTLSKIVEPIAKLFGGGSAAGASQTPANPERKDPTSDTTPPVLVSVQFNPDVVHDGEQSTVIVVATDDLSGVRNVSGSISSPSGKALGAFAFQKDEDSSQWIGHAQIPKDAEGGMWHLSFLSMTDNANNTANLTAASGTIPATAALRVISSTSDSTPPTLRRAWLDKRTVSEGEHNTLFIEATDEQSGVSVVGGVFQSPSKIARIGFGCRQEQGSDIWDCDIVLPKCVDCGNWTLEQIQLQDKANNQAVFRQSDPNVANIAFTAGGTSCDSTPPVLQSVSLSPTAVSNAQDSIVIITATITDDMCGVQNASGAVAGPAGDNGQPPRVYFPMAPLDDQPNVFQGKAIIPKTSAKGAWNLVWFTVVDKANNPRTYSTGDPVLANAKFTVQ
jgi:hypothetical protein